jgi:DtxR family Mn-dependent transcriptional regulator
MIHAPEDEVLEHLYYASEEKRVVSSPDELRAGLCDAELNDALAALTGEGAILSGNCYSLSEAGDRRARGIVRRHRLAEVLCVQALGTDLHEAEISACEMEHTLSESVVDRVCAFLGHPPVCPHGKPVPRGECCKRSSARIEPLISRIVDLPVGTSATIAFIAQTTLARIERLAAFGIVPGSEIRLVAKRPSCVLACGASSIALDDDIGQDIYVRVPRQGV